MFNFQATRRRDILHKAIHHRDILHKVILHSKETKLKTVVSLKDGIFLTFSAID